MFLVDGDVWASVRLDFATSGEGLRGLKTRNLLPFGCGAGLLIGVLTQIGQGVLPGSFNQLANSGAMWVIVAFVVGRFAATPVAAGGIGFLALVGELVGYYVAAYLELGYPPAWSLVLLWLMVACVGGPLVGWAGWCAVDGRPWQRVVGNGLIGGVFIGEGLYLLAVVDRAPAGIAWMIGGFLVSALLGWWSGRRLLGVCAPIAIGAVIFGAFLGLLWLDQWRAGLVTW